MGPLMSSSLFLKKYKAKNFKDIQVITDQVLLDPRLVEQLQV